MCKNKETAIKVIEFYLKNMLLINREILYRKQCLNTKDPVCINKLYSPIPFAELESISQSINSTIKNYTGEKAEYIELRYKNKCTYDVICGLMNKKRSTIFALGNEILDEILFNILLDDNSRSYMLNANRKSYFLN